jgi:hypothetical protein
MNQEPVNTRTDPEDPYTYVGPLLTATKTSGTKPHKGESFEVYIPWGIYISFSFE